MMKVVTVIVAGFIASICDLRLLALTEAREAIKQRPLLIENFSSDHFIYNNDNGCEIKINGDLKEPQPLFIVPETINFWSPDKNGVMKIASGQSIEMYCSDSFADRLNGAKRVLPICIGGKQFLVKGEKFEFDELVCRSKSIYNVRRKGQKCASDGEIIQIGFNVTNRFLQTMEICHNENLQMTYYTHHKLIPASYNYQKSVGRPYFSKVGFFGNKSVNNLYTKKKQIETIGIILGERNVSSVGDNKNSKYFDDKKSIYLSRGHLSAKTDHIFGTHQRSTFNYLNVAPQWQSFNEGSWNAMENAVRKLVAQRNLFIDCYTGTWGINTLPDINGNNRELFLSFDDNNNGQIPVPKLYYRVIIELNTNCGIALIGVNNPHAKIDEIKENYIICDDISDDIKWINWKRDNLLKGYFYACEVNQFAKAIGQLPTELHTSGILY